MSPVRTLTYLPCRTHISGYPPPADLGTGMIAINIPDRRMWIGTSDGPTEVTDLGQLIDLWVEIIERHYSHD